MNFKHELFWFLGGFGLPFLAIVGFDLLTSRSTLPLVEKFVRLEDFCAYAMCLLIPSLLYLLARLGAGLLR